MLIVSFQKMKGKGKYINQEIGGKRSFLEQKENERSKKKIQMQMQFVSSL